jgi:chromosome partitioning protein
MTIIAVLGRKGGSGKTTVAVHLAGELAARGRRVALIDADPQGSANHWAAPGLLGFTVHHHPVNPSSLADWLKAVRSVAADAIILDAPPHLDTALGAAVALADVALLPCGPSGLDVLASAEALGIIRAARKKRGGDRPRVLIVPNKLDKRTAEGRELVEELVKLGEPVAPSLAYRSAYVRAFNTGETVGSFAPGSPADQEVKSLADTVVKVTEVA